MKKIKKVLFLCSGNTCRSPFAEYYAKWLQRTKYKKELKDVRFDSAGLYHYFDKPQEGTVKYLNSKGIDISDFKSKVINRDLLNEQDLILGFEQKFHLDKLKRKIKNIADLDDKISLLLESFSPPMNSKNRTNCSLVTGCISKAKLFIDTL